VQERIKVKEKEKGNETTLFRYEGEVVGPFGPDTEGMKEEELVVKDPRLEPGFPGVRRSKSGKVNELAELKYDVRILKFVLLSTNTHIRS
jgi:hypothetical protein